MIGILIVVLLLLPFLDFYILLEATGELGLPIVIGLVLATGIAGAALLKREGRSVILRLQNSVTVHEASRGFLEAASLALGGVALLTPGFLTDIIGLTMVWRPTRQRIVVYLSEKMEDRANFKFEVHRF